MRCSSFQSFVALAALVLSVVAATACTRRGSLEATLPQSPVSSSTPPLPSPSEVIIPPGWKKIELRDFSFHLPPDMKERKVRGTDSEVWSFRSERLTLDIDYGAFSNDLRNCADEAEHRVEIVRIDGRQAKLCTYRRGSDDAYPEKDREYFAAINIPDVWGGNSGTGLTLHVGCLDSPAQDTANRIFQTIKFTWPPSNNGMHPTANQQVSHR